MKLKRTSSPALEPITLQQAKDHLKVSSTGEDSVITFEITAARRFIEREMGVQMISCGYEGYLDKFPDVDYIEFPIKPMTGVIEVLYFSTNILDSASCIFDEVHNPPRLYLAPGYSWPSTEKRVNAVKITFNAGYNAAADVPETWVEAVKMALTHFHEHRGDEGLVTLPKPIRDLINPDTVLTV
jgi:uncharacterized phiE125 gp8 family phage protein